MNVFRVCYQWIRIMINFQFESTTKIINCRCFVIISFHTYCTNSRNVLDSKQISDIRPVTQRKYHAAFRRCRSPSSNGVRAWQWNTRVQSDNGTIEQNTQNYSIFSSCHSKTCRRTRAQIPLCPTWNDTTCGECRVATQRVEHVPTWQTKKPFCMYQFSILCSGHAKKWKHTQCVWVRDYLTQTVVDTLWHVRHDKTCHVPHIFLGQNALARLRVVSSQVKSGLYRQTHFTTPTHRHRRGSCREFSCKWGNNLKNYARTFLETRSGSKGQGYPTHHNAVHICASTGWPNYVNLLISWPENRSLKSHNRNQIQDVVKVTRKIDDTLQLVQASLYSIWSELDSQLYFFSNPHLSAFGPS